MFVEKQNSLPMDTLILKIRLGKAKVKLLIDQDGILPIQTKTNSKNIQFYLTGSRISKGRLRHMASRNGFFSKLVKNTDQKSVPQTPLLIMFHPCQNSKFADYGFYFFSSDACQFHYTTSSSKFDKDYPLAHFICDGYEKTETIRTEDYLTYKDAVQHCLAKNESLCKCVIWAI